ncbi:hypothetical protein N665_0320s0029 [Sinapis alba]|nr:hypothetical protein N665_0320s0029 [Sinapis alba]
MGGIHAKTDTFLPFPLGSCICPKKDIAKLEISIFLSSLTNEDGFSYTIFEGVGYDFKTIQLNQLVRRLMSYFDPKKFSVAMH